MFKKQSRLTHDTASCARVHQTRTGFPVPLRASNHLKADGQLKLAAVSPSVDDWSHENATAKFFNHFFYLLVYIFLFPGFFAWLLIKNGSSEGILEVYVFLSFCTSFCSFRTQKNPFLFNMTNKIIFVMFFTIFLHKKKREFLFFFFLLIYPICWILDFFLLVEKY